MKYVPILQDLPEYTQAEEDALAAQMSGQLAGWAIIYNTTLDKARRWDGAGFVDGRMVPASLMFVSGTSIKTINGVSVLGAGDMVVGGAVAWGGITGTLSAQTDLQSALDAKQATLVSATNIKTINGATVLGAGDLVVSGSVAITQTEIDFGSVGVSEASFLITDASVSATSKLIGTVAYVAPTGKDLDELDMDQLDLKFSPGTGEFTLYATALNECLVADKFKINYQVGA